MLLSLMYYFQAAIKKAYALLAGTKLVGNTGASYSIALT